MRQLYQQATRTPRSVPRSGTAPPKPHTALRETLHSCMTPLQVILITPIAQIRLHRRLVLILPQPIAFHSAPKHPPRSVTRHNDHWLLVIDLREAPPANLAARHIIAGIDLSTL